jgi:hypothetical protein
MTQTPRFGLNKQARLAAERREQAAKDLVPPLDPPFPYTCLPSPFAGMEGVEVSSERSG